jgi:hypothetical protein
MLRLYEISDRRVSDIFNLKFFKSVSNSVSASYSKILEVWTNSMEPSPCPEADSEPHIQEIIEEEMYQLYGI